MIEIDRLSYAYPNSESLALKQIVAGFGPGSFVLLAGDSGSGKSTLLRTMNGLIPHFHGGRFIGRVLVDGRDTTSFRPRDFARDVGFVGQDPEDHAVVDRVEDDIAFTLENLGVEQVNMRKRVEEVLDALGIEPLRHRRLDTLSGGERQKAAIAGALAAMPGHLVLDEVTSQLDPQSAEEVLSALLRLRDELGVSIILAEHRLERVLQYADRLCLLEQGTMESGAPAEMFEGRDFGPPIVKLSRALGWAPVALSLRDARKRLDQSQILQGRGGGAPETPKGDLVLKARGLSVWLQGAHVLRNIDLHAAEGEVVAVMGRNGSGKTTLLRALAGLVRRHRGSVEAPRPVALVPQNPQKVLFRTTVAAEIAATLKGRSCAHGEEEIASEAVRFGVEHLLDRHPSDLSGGQRARAAIAAAAAGGVRTLLMDEPTRGMDGPGKRRLCGLIKQSAAQGAVVVIATHDVELAAEIATRVVILSGGEVVVDAPPHSALASSVTFSTQMNKVFQDASVLTFEDALRATGRSPVETGARP